jgi:hypothetical protein
MTPENQQATLSMRSREAKPITGRDGHLTERPRMRRERWRRDLRARRCPDTNNTGPGGPGATQDRLFRHPPRNAPPIALLSLLGVMGRSETAFISYRPLHPGQPTLENFSTRP